MSGTPTRVRPQSTRESLGGPWATNVWVWLLLLVPALVMSGYQDSSVPFPTALEAALAVFAECTAALLPFGVVSILRRHTRVIPLPLCLVFWASVGAIHGVTAGILASAIAGAQPHYPARIIFWAGACLIWLPLTTYAITQFADRRQLLATLAQSMRLESESRRESSNEIAGLRLLIVAAMRDNIRPVVAEIALSLQAIGPGLDSTQLAALGNRLADVSEETSRIIETTAAPAPMLSARLPVEPLAPVVAALDYEQRRPIRAALLTAAALLPITVALSLDVPAVRPVGLDTTAVVLGVAIVVLAIGMAALRLARYRGRRARTGTALAVYLAAGVSTAAAAFFGPWQPVNHQNHVLAVLLLLAVPFAAAAISAAVGLGNANLTIVSQIANAEHGIHGIALRLEERQREVRDQLATLTHGPLRGRLAACAMALNFHASEIETAPQERTEFIATSVLEHLADALHELDSLG